MKKVWIFFNTIFVVAFICLMPYFLKSMIFVDYQECTHNKEMTPNGELFTSIWVVVVIRLLYKSMEPYVEQVWDWLVG